MRIEPSNCTLEVAKSGALTYYAPIHIYMDPRKPQQPQYSFDNWQDSSRRYASVEITLIPHNYYSIACSISYIIADDLTCTCLITNIYNIIAMEYSCCVSGCKSNSKKDEPSVTVFKFPSIVELRQKLLQNIPRKFDKIIQSTRVCIKYFKDKDVHGFNIHTNPD